MEEPSAEHETAGERDLCWNFVVFSVKVVFSSWFNCVSILVILIDCAAQGSFQPCEGEHLIQEVIEVGVTVYFTMELIIKMRALGDYPRNRWHKLDIYILCVEYLVIILNICGVHVEWLLVISMLRMISRVDEMRKALSMICKILPSLANIFLVYFFIIYVFGVIGIQLWAGDLHRRCYLEENITQLYNQSVSPYYTSLPGEKVHYICSPKESGMRHCHDIPPLREGGNSCLLSPSQWELLADDQANASGCINWNAYYTVCRAGGPNPLLGSIHFDNIGYAWITVFQAYWRNRSTTDAFSSTVHTELTHMESRNSFTHLPFLDFSSTFNTIISQTLKEALFCWTESH
ncbi:voltage-dependent T-type calcium channel subunit alpha-1I-like, partial [Cyprinodon tularosa]|uniref:voltage-dependent T-type calcium channel subunit alpha-1I-like n=1 Tax=Cyprinodon tularosa TaxID=77115 RepID=UPI0018E270B5